MSRRVVLYAEGPGESSGPVRALPAPTHELADAHLGPAHILIRRIIAAEANCPVEAVRFIAPLRHRARTVRGSDLLVPATLRKLVAFPANARRPDLAIFLLDEDGDRSRASLADHLVRTVVPVALGVAVPEFEAWLLSDQACLNATLGRAVNAPSAPEGLHRGAAKALLAELLTGARLEGDVDAVRRQLARNCRLEVLEGVGSAERFIQEIRRKLAGHS